MRNEWHRLAVDHRALGVAHGHGRRITVRDQVDGRAVHAQRVIDSNDFFAGLTVGRFERYVRPILLHLAERDLVAVLLGYVVDVELVEGHREGLEGRGIEVGARVRRVVVDELVEERLAHDQHALPVEAEEPADGDAQEHPDERDVKEQVAGLAQVAALGRHRHLSGAMLRGFHVLHFGTVVLASQQCVGFEDRALGECLALFGRRARVRDSLFGVPGHALQPGRCARRLAPQRLPVMRDSGQHAPDQRDEQQQVDRREPDRRVDVEGLNRKRVEHLEQVGVILLVLQHAVRVCAALRHE